MGCSRKFPWMTLIEIFCEDHGLFQPPQITDLALRIRAINANAEVVNDTAGEEVLKKGRN